MEELERRRELKWKCLIEENARKEKEIQERRDILKTERSVALAESGWWYDPCRQRWHTKNGEIITDIDMAVYEQRFFDVWARYGLETAEKVFVRN